MKLMLEGQQLNAIAYSEWAEDHHERKSTTGCVFCLGDEVISWRLQRQKTVSLSSTEAEYMVMSDTH